MIEAKELLGSFDSRLRVYAARKLTQHGVSLQKVRPRLRLPAGYTPLQLGGAVPAAQGSGTEAGLLLQDVSSCCTCLGRGQPAVFAAHHYLLPSIPTHLTAALHGSSQQHLRSRPLLLQGAAKRVDEGRLTLTDDRTIDFGLCIWSTGVGPTPFITSLPFAKTKMGRLVVDGRLRVQGAPPGAADSPQQPPGGSNLQVRSYQLWRGAVCHSFVLRACNTGYILATKQSSA